MSNPFLNLMKNAVIESFIDMPDDWIEGHWFSGPGWYFADETEYFVGPYSTREVAQTAMYLYTQFLEARKVDTCTGYCAEHVMHYEQRCPECHDESMLDALRKGDEHRSLDSIIAFLAGDLLTIDDTGESS